MAWDASYTPFGKATLTVEVVENNLRFAGQYYDQETGLHHNGYRTYSPDLGRYIQSDRIGLGDGPNTYAYVGGNPLSYADPTGEFAILAAPWVAPAVTATTEFLINITAMAAIYTGLNSVAGDDDKPEHCEVEPGTSSTPMPPGLPDPDNVDDKDLSKQDKKSIRSLEKQIKKHEQKIKDFKENPTVRPGMENQPKEVIKAQQQKRIEHLQKEINTFKNNIDKIRQGKL